MTFDLDKYVKTGSLQIYVFDDTDPDEAAYLGVAKVPLLPLAHDKPVKGIFELRTVSTVGKFKIPMYRHRFRICLSHVCCTNNYLTTI